MLACNVRVILVVETHEQYPDVFGAVAIDPGADVLCWSLEIHLVDAIPVQCHPG